MSHQVYPDCWINIILASKRSGVLKNKATGECIDPRAKGGAKMVPCQTHQRNGNSQVRGCAGARVGRAEPGRRVGWAELGA